VRREGAPLISVDGLPIRIAGGAVRYCFAGPKRQTSLATKALVGHCIALYDVTMSWRHGR
jgi:hypothetical protein